VIIVAYFYKGLPFVIVGAVVLLAVPYLGLIIFGGRRAPRIGGARVGDRLRALQARPGHRAPLAARRRREPTYGACPVDGSAPKRRTQLRQGTRVMSTITAKNGIEAFAPDLGEGISELSSRSANGTDVALLFAEEIAHLRSWRPRIPDSVAAQVRDGRVILHARVESALQRDAAETAVRQLTGVRVVENLVKVEPQTEPTAADV
jgi:hypothetical protein